MVGDNIAKNIVFSELMNSTSLQEWRSNQKPVYTVKLCRKNTCASTRLSTRLYLYTCVPLGSGFLSLLFSLIIYFAWASLLPIKLGRVSGPLWRQDWPPAVIDALNSFSIKRRPCTDRFKPCSGFDGLRPQQMRIW